MNNNKTPIISIVIPVYNGEKYLYQTLDSLLSQTFTQFEVLLTDDCSLDSSSVVINNFKKKDSRIRYIKTNANLGIVPKVLSYALPHVRGSYFLYSSQDDLFSNDWLEKMYEMAKHTNADAVIPDMVFFHGDESKSDRKWIGLYGRRDVVLSNREAVELSLDWIIHGFVLWNINVIRNTGFFDFGMYADDYSVKNFYLKCNKVVFSEGVFFYRQDNPDAITKKVSYKRFDQPFNYYKIYEFLLENKFPLGVCERELEKAAIDLIGYAMDLDVLKKNQTSQFIAEADARLRQAYSVLNDKNILRTLRGRGGIKGVFRFFALRGSYSYFLYCCTVFSYVKRFRTKILRLSRK